MASGLEDGIPGRRVIRYQRPRKPLEGSSGSEEAPHHLAEDLVRLAVGRVEIDK